MRVCAAMMLIGALAACEPLSGAYRGASTTQQTTPSGTGLTISGDYRFGVVFER